MMSSSQQAKQLYPIKRALLSVSDKTNLIPLAQALINQGCELISTGGTRQMLQEAGLNSTDISSVTGNPEAFGGRMKTISFQIGSALLFDRERDAQQAQDLQIQAIDLVVCNLYPFGQVLKQGADFETLIENIDIGGPTMLRAAAKNFRYLTVLCDPEDYPRFLTELEQYQGQTSYAFRLEMMAKTFNHTADYDALIAQTLDAQLGQASKRLHFHSGKSLRYGENSQQQAQIFTQAQSKFSLATLPCLHGKALSYNNLLDLQAALDTLAQAQGNSAVIIKHNNPCGLAQAPQADQALALAWQGDSVSAFGSVIALNTEIDLKTAQFFELDNPDKQARKFIELLAAPSFSPDALDYLKQNPNLRIVLAQAQDSLHAPIFGRFLAGSLVWQDPNPSFWEELKLVSSGGQHWDFLQDIDLIAFGIQAVKHLKSNAIALVRREGPALQLIGMGTGQPNRLIATNLALAKAKENLHKIKGHSDLSDCLLISDAFFPFADNIELAAQAGIKKIVQPGGSIRDKEVIAKAESLGLAMLFSGLRHFKH